jgi:hypothetical protein
VPNDALGGKAARSPMYPCQQRLTPLRFRHLGSVALRWRTSILSVSRGALVCRAA